MSRQTKGSASPPASDKPTLKSIRVVFPVAAPQGESAESVELHPETGERWEFAGELGRGGMGQVVLARDRDIERTVAIKRLNPEHGAEDVARFVGEVRVLGGLEHPNIVPLYDVGRDDDGQYYFVMKRLRGESLERIISRLAAGDPTAHARYPFSARLSIIVGVLNAVGYAHARGVVHGDIKPANIMVGADGEVTLVDWGVAQRLNKASRGAPSHEVHGTPMYMSPEQARGEPLDGRSDLYSLTVVLHELLHLKHYLAAFENAPTEAQMTAVCRELPAVHVFGRHASQPAVPMELSWLVHRGLAKDRAERFADAAQMRSALAKAADGCFEILCPRTLLKRALFRLMPVIDEYPVRVFAALGLFVALLCALAVGAGLWVWQSALAGLAR